MGAEDQRLFRSAADTTLAQLSVEDTIGMLREDAEFFINFYIGEELDFPVPEFHKTSWRLLTSTSMRRIALALPREHAKTTLAKLAVVWYLLFTDFRFIVYVSNTATVASEACKDIVNYMRSDNHIQVFGELEFITEQDQRGFYKFIMRRLMKDDQGNEIVTEKVCILKPQGAGQQVRGLNIDNERPQLAIIDDLEDEENAGSDILIKKLKRWFYGPFMKALSKKRRKAIYLGNMLSNQSLLHSFCQPESGWSYMRMGCLLANGEALWPDLWPLEDIRQDFLEYQREGMIATWFAEMMNLPIAEGAGLIEGENIPYVNPILPGQHQAAFITVDPTSKQQKWNDSTAIVVHALYNEIWRPVDFLVGKYTPDQVFILLLELSLKWNTRVLGIEDAGFQILFKFIFEVMMKQHNYQLEFIMIPHHNQSKTARLMAWCSMLRKRVWSLVEGDFAITEQLLAYDPSKTNNKDDLIDACAMGVTMVNEYMPAIMQQFSIGGADQIRSGYAVVSI